MLTISHDEFGDQVHIVVTRGSQGLWGRLAWLEALPQLQYTTRCDT